MGNQSVVELMKPVHRMSQILIEHEDPASTPFIPSWVRLMKIKRVQEVSCAGGVF